MSERMGERRSDRAPDGRDRRQRKPDPWRKVLTALAYVVYPLLLINVLIFMSVASEDQKASMSSKIGQKAMATEPAVVQIKQTATVAPESTAQKVSGGVYLYAFMPLMITGVVIGLVGIVIDRKRARRRSDSSLLTPLVLIVLSVVGLFIYFVVRATIHA